MASRKTVRRSRSARLPATGFLPEQAKIPGAAVAIESSVFAHGLPAPHNLETAKAVLAAASEEGVTPQIIAVLEGQITLGVDDETIARMCEHAEGWEKLTFGDLAPALVQKATGAVTVSAMVVIASSCGLHVCATGGIGGVHRHYAETLDMSADLAALATAGGILVCSGIKAVLDVPGTFEVLETHGIPVIGFGTDELPGFYTTSTGIELTWHTDSVHDIIRMHEALRALNLSATLLVAQPPPREVAIQRAELDEWVHQALREASRREIRGKALTPFLLKELAELSEGRTLEVNKALLVENVRLAARIARELHAASGGRRRRAAKDGRQ